MRSYMEAAALPSFFWGGEVKEACPPRGPSLYIDEESICRRKDFLRSCLVGRFEDLVVEEMGKVQEWARSVWKMASGFSVAMLNNGYYLFRFPSKEVAMRVLASGRRDWGNRRMVLDAWSSGVGAVAPWQRSDVRRIFLKGIPLHLCCLQLFKRVGDLCGGFRGLEKLDSDRPDIVAITVAVGSPSPPFIFIHDDAICFRVSVVDDNQPAVVETTHCLEGGFGTLVFRRKEWLALQSSGWREGLDIRRWVAADRRYAKPPLRDSGAAAKQVSRGWERKGMTGVNDRRRMGEMNARASHRRRGMVKERVMGGPGTARGDVGGWGDTWRAQPLHEGVIIAKNVVCGVSRVGEWAGRSGPGFGQKSSGPVGERMGQVNGGLHGLDEAGGAGTVKYNSRPVYIRPVKLKAKAHSNGSGYGLNESGGEGLGLGQPGGDPSYVDPGMEPDPDPTLFVSESTHDGEGSDRNFIPVAMEAGSLKDDVVLRVKGVDEGLDVVSRRRGKEAVVRGVSRRVHMERRFAFDGSRPSYMQRRGIVKGKRRFVGPLLLSAKQGCGISVCSGVCEKPGADEGGVMCLNKEAVNGSMCNDLNLTSDLSLAEELDSGSEWGYSTGSEGAVSGSKERAEMVKGREDNGGDASGVVSEGGGAIICKELEGMEVLENVAPIAIDCSELNSDDWVKDNVVNVASLIGVKFGIHNKKGEELILDLVKDSGEEESSKNRAVVVHRSPSYWKGERELRNLVCTVNYDGCGSGSRGSEGERGGGRRRGEAV